MTMKKALIPGLLMIAVVVVMHISEQEQTFRIDSNKKLQEYLAYGWNTWNNPNLLSFVRMPEGLSLQLSFRLTYRSGGPYYLDSGLYFKPVS